MENMNRDSDFGAEQHAPSMDDINALLAKAGLSPIGEDGTGTQPSAAPDKTKHFSLPKQEAADDAPEKTRVISSAQTQATQTVASAPKTSPEKAAPEKKNDSQILLEGFDDTMTPRHVNEAEEEERLKNE